jgi:hypothetical protein
MLRDWVPLFLFLHVMGAIVAFGPSFAFPLIAAASAREPQHAHFGAEVSEVITKRIVLPLAVVQGITGVLLILALGLDLLNTRWLLVAIVLYLAALGYSYFVQLPTGGRMVELTAMAGGGPPPGASGPQPGAGGPPPGAGGPPPELLATGRKLQRGGIFLTTLIVLIVLLMVTKPF